MPRREWVWRRHRWTCAEQIIVIDISETHDDLLVLINPEILASSGEVEREEGCLSVPGIYEEVRAPNE